MINQLWDRQENESSKAYAAFCIYRDMGSERSIEKIKRDENIRGTSGVLRNLYAWSSQYSWVSRVTAYDDYLQEKKRIVKEKKIIAMAERHATIAMSVQSQLAKKLHNLDYTEIQIKDIAGLLKVSTELERLSLGMLSEYERQKLELEREKLLVAQKVKVELTGKDGESLQSKINLSVLSTEELEQLETIISRTANIE